MSTVVIRYRLRLLPKRKLVVEKGRKRKKGAGKRRGKGGEETACVEQDQTVTEE